MDAKSGKKYDIFLYRFGKEKSYFDIESKLRDADADTGVMIRDISEDAANEKLRILTYLIVAERNREYKEGTEKKAYVNIVKYSRDAFIAVISIYGGGDEEKTRVFLTGLLGTAQYSYWSKMNSKDDCVRFWNQNMHDYILTGKKEYDVTYEHDGFEVYPIKLEYMDDYKDILKNSPRRLKAAFSDALGKIMCRFAKLENVLGEDIYHKGRLTRVPVWVSEKCSDQSVENLNSYFISIERYDGIGFDELKRISKIDLINSCMYSQMFIYDTLYNDIVPELRENKLIRIDAMECSNTPLKVTFMLDGNTPNISYEYDSTYFEKVSFEGFSKLLCKLVSDSINSVYVDFKIDDYLTKVDDVAAKIQSVKELCIRKSKWFEQLSDRDISKLAKNMEIVKRFTQQCVINSGTKPDKIYLIAFGKIILEGRDMEGYARSLLLIKEGEYFGLESLLDGQESYIDYRIESEEAIMLALDAKYFYEFMSEHPAIFRDVIKTQTDRLTKFEKLWAMS